MKKIICLWSCPRNISTALMYSFGNREDTEIYGTPGEEWNPSLSPNVQQLIS